MPSAMTESRNLLDHMISFPRNLNPSSETGVSSLAFPFPLSVTRFERRVSITTGAFLTVFVYVSVRGMSSCT